MVQHELWHLYELIKMHVEEHKIREISSTHCISTRNQLERFSCTYFSLSKFNLNKLQGASGECGGRNEREETTTSYHS